MTLSEKNKELRHQWHTKIKELSKFSKVARIVFHQDLDGLATAIALRDILRTYGIKVIDAEWIQYGGFEYAINPPKKGVIQILVDFSHGKTCFDIHTDHHESQIGVKANTLVYFPKARSNAEVVSHILAEEPIFSDEDIEIIKTVDSANYLKNDITVDDVLCNENSNKDLPERTRIGLTANKLLLAYKNRPALLRTLLIGTKPEYEGVEADMGRILEGLEMFPSALMYDTDSRGYPFGYAPLSLINKHSAEYIKRRETELGNYNGIAFQLCGGNMYSQGSYDRYTAFKVFPDVDFLSNAWGESFFVQASCNPFKKKEHKLNLGIIKDIVLEKLKPHLQQTKISLLALKTLSEAKCWTNKNPVSMGFTSDDFIAIFGEEKLNELTKTDDVKRKVIKALNYPSKSKDFLTPLKELGECLEPIQVDLYDIMKSKSGGHTSITNISGMEYLSTPKSRQRLTELVQDSVMFEICKQTKGTEAEEFRADMAEIRGNLEEINLEYREYLNV